MNHSLSPISDRFVYWVLILFVLFLSVSTRSVAQEGCWVELFESPSYSGASVRLEGPLKLSTLHSVHNEDWDRRIDSLKMGPKSRLWLYEHVNFKLILTEMAKHPDQMRSLGLTQEQIKEESELIFNPDEHVHHLGEYDFHKKTRSLVIKCVD